MFFTVQLPFTDLRPYLNDVPKRLARLTFDSGNPSPNSYLRSFGKIKERGFKPEFQKVSRWPILDFINFKNYYELPKLWSGEYYYAWSRNGLRLPEIEKHSLLNGKLSYPRVKVRAIHFSPHDPSSVEFSPIIRIELGVHYLAKEPLTGGEVEQALRRFLKITAKIPKLPCPAKEKPKFTTGPLEDKTNELSRLIAVATKRQSDARIHARHIPAAKPMLTVHFFPGEIVEGEDPLNTVWLPHKVTSGERIGYFPLRTNNGLLGTWLFECPSGSRGSKLAKRRREVIRNYTVATMRYWAELKGFEALVKLLTDQKLQGLIDFSKNSRLKGHIVRSGRFLKKPRWHRSNLNVIANVVASYTTHFDQDINKKIDSGEVTLRRVISEVLPEKKSPFIFVSYSHKDRHWQQILHEGLAPLNKNGHLAYFDDSEIEAGMVWKSTIEKAIERANCTVLLLSKNFFASEFIVNFELPKIIDSFKLCTTKIIAVEVDEVPDSLLSEFIEIGENQFFNKKAPFSLMKSNEVSAAVNKLKIRIRQITSSHGDDTHGPL